MFKGLRFEIKLFHLRMLDKGDIQKLRSPSQELFNDVLYVCLSQNFIISVCLKSKV